MVRQDLQATTETLAARDAELAELKNRIETLEELQADQQKLLSMKDSELASAQEQLAQSQSVDDGPAGSATPWLLGGAVLVLVLVGAWWWRRRADSTPRFRPPQPPARAPSGLAAGFPPVAAEGEAEVEQKPDVLNPQAVQPAPATAPEPGAGTQPPAAGSVTPVSKRGTTDVTQLAVPAWHAGSEESRLNKAPPAESASPSRPIARPVAAASTQTGASDSEAPGMERLELARAYLDLGDEDSARQLLGELEVSGSLQARQQATRLLRELG